MKTIGWMLSLLGSIIGGFTAWAERIPGLQDHLLLPHANIPGWDITGVASLMALIAVCLVWMGLPRLGGLLVILASLLGMFGADQLWATAGCVLFIGAVLTLFAPVSNIEDSEA